MYKQAQKRCKGCRQTMYGLWIKLCDRFPTVYSQGYKHGYTQVIHELFSMLVKKSRN